MLLIKIPVFRADYHVPELSGKDRRRFRQEAWEISNQPERGDKRGKTHQRAGLRVTPEVPRGRSINRPYCRNDKAPHFCEAFEIVVPELGIEPRTRGFSIPLERQKL